MKNKTQKNIINIIAILMFLAIFSWVSNEDLKDAQIAEQQAQYVKQLAQQEADERKREFNALAEQGEYMTGFAGNTK